MTKEEKSLLKSRGTLMDIMFQINPEHKSKKGYENWQKVLYICWCYVPYVGHRIDSTLVQIILRNINE